MRTELQTRMVIILRWVIMHTVLTILPPEIKTHYLKYSSFSCSWNQSNSDWLWCFRCANNSVTIGNSEFTWYAGADNTADLGSSSVEFKDLILMEQRT